MAISYPISRLRVAASGVLLPRLDIPTPLTFVGAGSSLSLCWMLASSGIQRLMLVTDKPLLSLGLADPMLETLKAAGVEVELFSDVEPDPGYEIVEAGIARLKASRAQAILAVGGGSPIDCAKAINLAHANDCHPAKLAGVWLYSLPRKAGLPFYAVPTTAGTGSEVTMAAVISDKAAGTKLSIIDPKALPIGVALDPALTLGLPAQITAATGMDALTHAVESWLSSTSWSQTEEWGVAATRLILGNLEAAYADGTNMAAREAMLLGSYLAGMAFTRAGVGYVHAIAHQFGGLYHLPHGLANAILLPHVLESSRPDCDQRLARLARLVSLPAEGDSDAALATAFIDRIRQLNAAMGIPDSVEPLQAADFERIIDSAFAEAHGTYGVPRYFSREDARKLLARLLPTQQSVAGQRT
jgi:alcohol dehydrogenase class IV